MMKTEWRTAEGGALGSVLMTHGAYAAHATVVDCYIPSRVEWRVYRQTDRPFIVDEGRVEYVEENKIDSLAKAKSLCEFAIMRHLDEWAADQVITASKSLTRKDFFRAEAMRALIGRQLPTRELLPHEIAERADWIADLMAEMRPE